MTGPRGIRTEWVKITPKMAEEMLGKFNTSNRPMRRLVVSRYAHDMNVGQFPVTHQGVAFAEDGTLIDGQHRLAAIRQSGKAMWMLVSSGHPAEIQEYLDRGARRRPSDFLDGKHSKLRVAATRALLAVKVLDGKCNPTDLHAASSLVTDADILAAINADDQMSEDLVELSTQAYRASVQCLLTPTGLLAAAATFPHIAERTMLKIETGAGLEIGDPVLALRNHSENRRISGSAQSIYHSLRVFEAVERGKVWKKMQIDGVYGDVVVPTRIR